MGAIEGGNLVEVVNEMNSTSTVSEKRIAVARIPWALGVALIQGNLAFVGG